MTPREHTDRAEDNEVNLPFGVKLKGASAKSFMQNLGWFVAVGAIGFAAYGPPQKMMMALSEIKGQLVEIDKRMDRIERVGTGGTRRRPADIAMLKKD